MSIKTIPIREMEKQTEDIFEATAVIAERARQIIADRSIKMEISEMELEPGLLEEMVEPVEDYVEEKKPVTVALREFLDGELEWRYNREEEEEKPE